MCVCAGGRRAERDLSRPLSPRCEQVRNLRSAIRSTALPGDSPHPYNHPKWEGSSVQRVWICHHFFEGGGNCQGVPAQA